MSRINNPKDWGVSKNSGNQGGALFKSSRENPEFNSPSAGRNSRHDQRERDQANREMLLLGENTRLKEKINRVIDDAGSSMEDLLKEHELVRAHYRLRSRELRIQLAEARADAAAFRVCTESCEAEISQHKQEIRSLVRCLEKAGVHHLQVDMHALEAQWASVADARTQAAMQARQDVLEKAAAQERELERNEEQATNGNGSSLEIETGGEEKSGALALTAWMQQTPSTSNRTGWPGLAPNSLDTARSGSSGQRSASPSPSSKGLPSTVEGAADMAEISRLNAKIDQLRMRLLDAEAVASEAHKETVAALQLFEKMSLAHTACVDTRGSNFQNRSREKRLLESIRNSSPLKLAGGGLGANASSIHGGRAGVGMHAAYRAVPYQERLAQIQRDRASLEEKQSPGDERDAEREALERNQRHLPSYMRKDVDKKVRVATLAHTVAGKSTKSHKLTLVPRKLDLMSTPVRVTFRDADIHGAAERNNQRNESDEDDYSEWGPDNSDSNGPQPRVLRASPEAEPELAFSADHDGLADKVRKELETLWDARPGVDSLGFASANATGVGSGGSSGASAAANGSFYTSEEAFINLDVGGSLEPRGSGSGGAAAPVTLAELLLRMTTMVGADIVTLRSAADSATVAREYWKAQSAALADEYKLEIAKLQTDLSATSESLAEQSVKCREATFKHANMEVLVAKVQRESADVQNKLETQLKSVQAVLRASEDRVREVESSLSEEVQAREADRREALRLRGEANKEHKDELQEAQDEADAARAASEAALSALKVKLQRLATSSQEREEQWERTRADLKEELVAAQGVAAELAKVQSAKLKTEAALAEVSAARDQLQEDCSAAQTLLTNAVSEHALSKKLSEEKWSEECRILKEEIAAGALKLHAEREALAQLQNEANTLHTATESGRVHLAAAADQMKKFTAETKVLNEQVAALKHDIADLEGINLVQKKALAQANEDLDAFEAEGQERQLKVLSLENAIARRKIAEEQAEERADSAEAEAEEQRRAHIAAIKRLEIAKLQTDGELAELQKTYKKKCEQLEQTEVRQAEQGKELGELQKALKKKGEHLEQAQERLNELGEERLRLREDTIHLTEDVHRAQELQRQARYAQEAAAESHRNADLQAQIREAQQQLAHCKDLLAASASQVNTQAEQLQVARGQSEEYSKKVRALEFDVVEARKMGEAATALKSTAAMEAEVATKLQHYRDESSRASNQLTQANKDLKDLNKRFAEQTAALESAKQASQTEQRSLRIAIETAKADHAAAVKQVAEHRQASEACKQQLELESARRHKAESALQQVAQMEDAKLALATAVQLREASQERESVLSSELRQERQQREVERTRHEQQLREREEQVSTLSSAVEAELRARRSLEQTLHQREQDWQSSEQRHEQSISHWKLQLQNLIEERVKDSELMALKTSKLHAEYKSQCEELQMQLDALTKELAASRVHVADISPTISQLKDANFRLERSLEQQAQTHREELSEKVRAQADAFAKERSGVEHKWMQENKQLAARMEAAYKRSSTETAEAHARTLKEVSSRHVQLQAEAAATHESQVAAMLAEHHRLLQQAKDSSREAQAQAATHLKDLQLQTAAANAASQGMREASAALEALQASHALHTEAIVADHSATLRELRERQSAAEIAQRTASDLLSAQKAAVQKLNAELLQTRAELEEAQATAVAAEARAERACAAQDKARADVLAAQAVASDAERASQDYQDAARKAAADAAQAVDRGTQSAHKLTLAASQRALDAERRSDIALQELKSTKALLQEEQQRAEKLNLEHSRKAKSSRSQLQELKAQHAEQVAQMLAEHAALQGRQTALEAALKSAHADLLSSEDARRKADGRLYSLQKAFTDKLSHEQEGELEKRRLQAKVQALQGDVHLLHDLQEQGGLTRTTAAAGGLVGSPKVGPRSPSSRSGSGSPFSPKTASAAGSPGDSSRRRS